MLTPAILVLAPAIVVAAYVIFGIIGFGSTLIAVPLLAHLLPLKFVIPMISLLDFSAAIRIGTQFRANISRREMAYLLPRGDTVLKAWVDQWMHLAKANGEYDRIVESWIK